MALVSCGTAPVDPAVAQGCMRFSLSESSPSNGTVTKAAPGQNPLTKTWQHRRARSLSCHKPSKRRC